MKEQLRGIALVLFGILLCCAERELNRTIFAYMADVPVSFLGVLVGLAGLFFAFRNGESK